MADYDLKTITPKVSVAADTEFLFGAADQSAGTPVPYAFSVIKTWIKSWSDALYLKAASNLSDLADAPTARNNLGLTPLMDPDFTDTSTYLAYPYYSVIGAGVMFANTLYMIPVWVPRTRTYSTYALAVTTLAAGASIRIGIYASSGGSPTGFPIDEAATPIDASTGTGSTGLKTPAMASSHSLKPGLYFIAVVSNAGPQVVRMSSPALGGLLGSFFTASAIVGNVGLSRSFTYGTLPDETAQTYTASGNGGIAPPYPGIR